MSARAAVLSVLVVVIDTLLPLIAVIITGGWTVTTFELVSNYASSPAPHLTATEPWPSPQRRVRAIVDRDPIHADYNLVHA